MLDLTMRLIKLIESIDLVRQLIGSILELTIQLTKEVEDSTM